MASSNRHWPSMFKSKPCNPHHQWQHDINSSLMSIGCHRSPYDTPAAGSCDERNPEPKPRWNPKPEQIRILEAIFNSGMVNPPRDEIRKIRMQLQEYGQVGDANVFYWFQNRKSRSKHKLRHLQNSSKNMTQEQQAQQNLVSLPQNTAPSSSSSSSSEKSSPKDKILPTNNKGFSIGFTNINERVPNSPTPSVNQTYFQTYNETNLLPHASEPFFFPLHHNGQGMVDNAIPTQGFCFSDLSNVIQPHPQQNVMPCTNTMMLSEVRNYGTSSKKDQYQEKAVKIMHQYTQPSFCLTSTPTNLAATVAPPITNTTVTVPSPIAQLQGVGEAAGTERATVFINDVAFEIPVGPLNVREAFGDQAVLLYSSGHPVPTDEWGVTLQSLHHGASYYLI